MSNKKIIVFGAIKDYTENFIEKNSSLQVVSIMDNDKNKWGQFLAGVKVVSPEKIDEFDFEQLIIIVQSQASLIKKQLINLGVKEHKIWIPAKVNIKGSKPFKDDENYKLATDILKNMIKVSNDHDILIYPCYGTLLGLVRDLGIIRWDDDIDFVMNIDALQEIDGFLFSIYDLYKNDLPIEIEEYKTNDNKISQIVIKINKNKKCKQFSISICGLEVSGDYLHRVLAPGSLFFPKQHCELGVYEEFLWNNINIKVPKNYQDLISYLYGKDWRVPNKNFTIVDYKAEELSKERYFELMDKVDYSIFVKLSNC